MPPTVPDCLGPPSGQRDGSLGVGPSRSLSVAQLLIPVSSAAILYEVEQVPLRLDGADVAWFLHRIDGCVEKLRNPRSAGSYSRRGGTR